MRSSRLPARPSRARLARRVGTTATLAVLLSVPATAATAHPAGRADAVVFSSDRDGDPELYLRQPDGRVRQLTRNTASDTAPVWSPDGRRLAFVSDRGGSPAIWVANASGGRARQVTAPGTTPEGRPAFDTAPAWSPDGRRIAFASNRDGGIEVYVVALPTGAVTRLTDSEPFVVNTSPAWSPDGASIAFVSDRGSTFRPDVYRMTATGDDVRPVTDVTDDHEATQPDWSPDGETLAVTSDLLREDHFPGGLGQQGLFTVDADGGPLTLVYDSARYDDVAPRWTADGQRLVFWTFDVPEEGESSDVWVVDADGTATTATRLTDTPAADEQPDPRPAHR